MVMSSAKNVSLMKQTVVNLICQNYDTLGLGVTWITALGPMSFAISSVFGDDELDETETFNLKLAINFKNSSKKTLLKG